MECTTFLRNIQDLLSDGKTPYERRFGKPCKGPIIPFGSLVEYYPITAKDQSRFHQFGKKVLPGLFLGYQDLLSHGKTPYERRLGIPINGPVIPFGAPYFCERPIEITPISSKSLARYMSLLRIVRGRNVERRHTDRRH